MNTKRVLALVLALMMTLTLFGCGEKPAEDGTDDAPKTVTITDMIGRQVEIVPGSYQRVVCIGAGALRLYSYVGDVSLLCGVEDIDNTTLEDLLVQAGGLLESASTVRVDVSRRIRDTRSMYPGKQTAEIFTFSVKDGFVIDGLPGFVLKPYDVVEVRRSPGYQVQRLVTVAGEAVFAGGYTLTKKNERLSDLVSRAGGLTPEAYVRGGRLIRRMNEEERAQRQAALDMAMMNAGSDSVSVAKLRLSDTYTVGIELDKALANPGSDYDVVLREGDYLYIPEYVSTVKITGEVQFPNTVTYIAGKSKSYYIDQAGGYGKMAKKRSAYVVHMNGTVTRIKRFKGGQIEPGCQIIVPSKKERKGMSIAEIVSLTTSAASIGTMAATIANLTK